MKKAIIIGASSGIGRELTRLLVNDNFKVGITGRRGKLLKEMNKAHSYNIIHQCYDIAKANNSRELAKLVRKLGGLDLLIFCAGCEARNPKLDIKKETTSIATNVKGFIEVANWVLRYFIKQGRGQLIAISSIAGLRGGRIAPSYNASKAFQINYMEGLRQRIRKMKLPISITDIRPGFVDTDLANKDVMFWEISPQKAAEMIYRSIKRKVDVAYVPIRWWIFVVLLRIVPNFLYKML